MQYQCKISNTSSTKGQSHSPIQKLLSLQNIMTFRYVLKRCIWHDKAYGKYNHKIKFLKDVGPSNIKHSALRGMSVLQLKFVKKFLEEHLKKRFIEASSAPCSSPILLAKKPGGGIRYCVNYQKLNSQNNSKVEESHYIHQDWYPANILQALYGIKLRRSHHIC